ncbi:MAG: helix-turn-helix domain-containing protein [Alteromonas macleodii]|nr:helix-turn-helix domain-containing protein [Alteromonas macleodii]
MNTIALSKINLEAPTQLRALGESMSHIEELAHSFADTGTFTELPWVALIKETGEYVPIDGFHRLNAIDWLTKQNEIPVEVDLENVAIRYSEFETMAEAIVAAAGVNAKHGLKRKKGDIQNTIRKLLEVDRIGFMKNKYQLDKKKIKEVVGCSDRVYEVESKSIRGSLLADRNMAIDKLHAEGLSHREIAERVGATHPTVMNVLGGKKTHNAEIYQSKNEQQEVSHEENTNSDVAPDSTEEAPEEQSSVFAHITEAKVAECPWDDVEEDVEVREEATGPSFSETHSQARIRLFIEDLSEEDKAYALKLLAV